MHQTKRLTLKHEFDRRRRITQPLYKLNAHRRKMLEKMPLQEFFGVQFLRILLKKGYEPFELRSVYMSAPNVLRCITTTWPKAKTLGDLVRQPLICVTLAEISGFGSSALVLLADSLTAVGYEITYTPLTSPRTESREERKARELARRLGL